MKTIVYLGIITLFSWFCLPLSAQNVYTVSSVPNVHLQNAADYVTNPDRIISESAKAVINEKIAAIENESSAEIAVVLISSIGNDDIDDFATRLFTQWGIGKKNDNGLLFLLVNDKKQMVFRTGYGVEGVLPDAILSRVIRNDISPLLRSGDFDGGIIAGIKKVGDYLKDPEAVKEIMQQEKNNPAPSYGFLRFYLVLSVIIAVSFFLYLFSKNRVNSTNYQKYLSLNNKKGMIILCTVLFPVIMIFFIMIYFLMLKRLRTKPIVCSQCGSKMLRLTAPALNAYLTPAQKTEETIGSIDYDVWHCDHCGNTEALPFNNQMSKYAVCPNCRAKAYYLVQDRVIRQATSFAQGEGERTYACMNCKETDSKLYNIPRIIPPPINSNSRGGWGGGFGGGGGGSWGGGRTGGGGARGGW